MPTTRTVMLAKRNPVPRPPAPGGLAQVDDVRRTRVRLVYAARTGRLRFPVVAAGRLARMMDRDPVLPLANPFGRTVGRRARSKAFVVERA